jgi:hypothetical protein
MTSMGSRLGPRPDRGPDSRISLLIWAEQKMNPSSSLVGCSCPWEHPSPRRSCGLHRSRLHRPDRRCPSLAIALSESSNRPPDCLPASRVISHRHTLPAPSPCYHGDLLAKIIVDKTLLYAQGTSWLPFNSGQSCKR